MSDEKFKLPRSSYEEVVKIIKTYGQFDEPKSLDDVSKLVGMNPANISSNNAFLTQIEVIESGQKKLATAKGRDLARALEHEMPNEIRKSWRRVVSECPFLQNLVSAIKIRKGMDEGTLVSHIAYSAGEPKKAYVMTGARAVVDILRAAEVIMEIDGKFVVNRADVVDEGEIGMTHDVQVDVLPRKGQPARTVVADILPAQQIGDGSSAAFIIRVDVKVTCQFSELDELGSKLVNLLKTVKEAGENPKTDNAE
ncbi:MAG: hypothetical protein K8R36_21755 [Planctomycetales bacterium]|nr:hypothetical protein [Planctomycetales bacterium]